jgi:hypothetical protein
MSFVPVLVGNISAAPQTNIQQSSEVGGTVVTSSNTSTRWRSLLVLVVVAGLGVESCSQPGDDPSPPRGDGPVVVIADDQD